MLATIVAVAVVLTLLVLAASSLGNNMLSLWTTRDPDLERYRDVARGDAVEAPLTPPGAEIDDPIRPVKGHPRRRPSR